MPGPRPRRVRPGRRARHALRLRPRRARGWRPRPGSFPAAHGPAAQAGPKRRLPQFDPTFIEPDDSWESSSDRPYPLDQHGRDVSALAKSNAELAGLAAHSSSLGLAGLLHDTGKAAPRFQAWLHGGNARRAEMGGTLYAKSVVAFTSRRELNASRERAGYPLGARHELISVRLAECDAALPPDLHPDQRDLILHLIASHHGFCRPFAPVVVDAEPRPFTRRLNDRTLSFTPDGSLSGHGLERLDSGVAERFWTLTRRYGWWGLPYLEALLRLADWACGEPPEHTTTTPPTALPAGRDPVAAAKQEDAS
ncbi:CRISPR-associated endonuclease Cas3'' [Leptolyngbya sp. 15MV]|nr:CRISPR-associated endonuclease Cas3'' [Leptolyngbya sp. 15MV]